MGGLLLGLKYLAVHAKGLRQVLRYHKCNEEMMQFTGPLRIPMLEGSTPFKAWPQKIEFGLGT